MSVIGFILKSYLSLFAIILESVEHSKMQKEMMKSEEKRRDWGDKN